MKTSDRKHKKSTKASVGTSSVESVAFENVSLISDPIHGYIRFTSPTRENPKEITERDIIDTPWMQRLRRIHQLQSAFWVFPSAEHSRFQHSLGAMYLASRFARHLYPSLKRRFKTLPSEAYVEETLRLAALLHDVGHGPFSHFFDENFLDQYDLNHEVLGQAIIVKKLGKLIRGIRRSSRSPLKPKEQLNPVEVAYLIRRHVDRDQGHPEWLRFLRALFSGIYTVDNLDYVLRDSYMTGLSIDPIDVDRILFYTYCSNRGLTIHRSGLSALTQFINARLHLFKNVYYHRATRAIDIHMREIFRETIEHIFPDNPVKCLDRYLDLTDWFILQEVERWDRSPGSPAEKKLGGKWRPILRRKLHWKEAFEHIFTLSDYDDRATFALLKDSEDLERRIREALPAKLRKMMIRVDLAHQDPRPINLLKMGDAQIYVYNPSTGRVEIEYLKELFKFIPAKVIQCRIFSRDNRYNDELSKAFNSVFSLERSKSGDTNL